MQKNWKRFGKCRKFLGNILTMILSSSHPSEIRMHIQFKLQLALKFVGFKWKSIKITVITEQSFSLPIFLGNSKRISSFTKQNPCVHIQKYYLSNTNEFNVNDSSVVVVMQFPNGNSLFSSSSSSYTIVASSIVIIIFITIFTMTHVCECAQKEKKGKKKGKNATLKSLTQKNWSSNQMWKKRRSFCVACIAFLVFRFKSQRNGKAYTEIRVHFYFFGVSNRYVYCVSTWNTIF